MGENTEVKSPECEKLAKLDREIRAITEFLEWLESQGIELRKPDTENLSVLGEIIFYNPILKRHNELINEFYGIDSKKVEEERKEILKNIQNLQK